MGWSVHSDMNAVAVGIVGVLDTMKLRDLIIYSLNLITDSGMTIPGTADYVPDCMWIDANGDQPVKAFQVNWVDMQASDPSREGQNASTLCDSPSFKLYTNDDQTSIVYWTPTNQRQRSSDSASIAISAEGLLPPNPQRNNKRGSSFSERFDNVLIVDDLDVHTAEALCESEMSSGPDFVNTALGGFCDMKTKTMYPVCNANLTNGVGTNTTNSTSIPCFDLNSFTLGKRKRYQTIVFARSTVVLTVCVLLTAGPGVRRRQSPYKVQDWRHQRLHNRKRNIDSLTWDMIL